MMYEECFKLQIVYYISDTLCVCVFRRQMDHDLEQLREEVRSLQQEEQGRLEEDKSKLLERIKSQVKTSF